MQFVNRYDQIAYCCSTLIDTSDHEICAPLQMEKYFQIHSINLCLTKLTGYKSLTSIHADPEYTGVQNFDGWGCVFLVQTLEAA